MNKKKILVVGQTPPPFGGQAVMIEAMLKGQYNKIAFHHVRMAFSKEMNEIGKVKIFKIFHLFTVVFNILSSRFTHNVKILYYPPTGPNKVPFLRDAFILILVRPFFKEIYFHFHASGISELYPKLGLFLQFVFRRAYYHADLGIRLSSQSPEDCKLLKCTREMIIPNGIEDNCAPTLAKRQTNKVDSILFVGLLTESKGLLILIQACHVLNTRGVHFHVNVMGKFESMEFETRAKKKIEEYGLQSRITFLGVLTGAPKHEVFRKSDIFCFPTFFEAENFPVVLLEAFSFGLPAVSSEWRGIPDIVENGKTGFLCPVKDFTAVADKVQLLLQTPALARELGENGRKVFLEKFSIDRFHLNIEQAFSSL
jgi:glycosyltransferase involved in cell wall biosynthesis